MTYSAFAAGQFQNRFSALPVFPGQFRQNPSVFIRQSLLAQFPEQDILFLSLMQPVDIGPQKIDCRVKEFSIEILSPFYPVNFPFEQGDHSFNDPVFIINGPIGSILSVTSFQVPWQGLK